MKAEILINKNFVKGEIDRRIYGSFIEHLGRAVYGGIYEPGHPTADKDGFRGDVIDLVKDLKVPAVRYPGGNFVSNYHWEDGIGDKEKRPKRIDLAWHSVEPNLVGIDEFAAWAKKADTEVMMAVNLGTGTPQEAVNCLEYCNGNMDSHYANLRRENGTDEPHNIKVWCLGNEMDGEWQTGHKTADEYGRLAVETAKMMKQLDPSIELVICGSSFSGMPGFASWDATVLDHAYEEVDYISLHAYYGNLEGDSADFLACSTNMDKQIEAIVATCDYIKAKKKSDKTMMLSFDEWNVWFHSNGEDRPKWQVAPSILEDIYTFEDALLVGCMVMSLQNHCDRVKMACLAQLVNIIGAIMTETGGKAWAQTIYYPFMYGSVYGNGCAMDYVLKCDKYDSKDHTDVPYVAASVIHNPETDEVYVFAVNRSLDEDVEFDIIMEDFGDIKPVEHTELYHDDLKAVNDKDTERVKPQKTELTGERTIRLKKHSWNMIKFSR